MNYFMEGHHASPYVCAVADNRRDDLDVGGDSTPDDRTDSLNAARGIVNGLIIGALIWGVAGLVVVMLLG